MHVEFKKIQEEEVNKLRNIALETFIQSYEHLNTPTNFKWYIERAFTIEKLTEELQNENSYYYFVMLESDIIGYLKLNTGSSQTESYDDEYIEIERIYLDKLYQGKGIGKLMITFALEKAITMNKSKIWLGVWEKNPAAIKFYNKVGFQINGTHIFKFGDEDQTDLLMEMPVSKGKV